MILWINGNYGVGKSSVANLVNEKYPGHSKVLDPDELWLEALKENKITIGGFYPQNNKDFVKLLKEKINKEMDKYDGVLIIPMTITEEYSYNKLIQQFYYGNIKHIVLKAEKEVLKKRINQDEGRDTQLAISNIDRNDIFFKNKKIDMLIDTTYKSIEEVADEVINAIQ